MSSPCEELRDVLPHPYSRTAPKLKEVVLRKDKISSADTLAVFVKETVIFTSERIHTLRGEFGADFTSAEFRQYCEDVGINRICLCEHPSANRSERACGSDDLEHRALFSRRRDTSELPLAGADEDGCLPEHPDSSRRSANRDAVHSAQRQGRLSRPSPGDRVPGIRARRGLHQYAGASCLGRPARRMK